MCSSRQCIHAIQCDFCHVSLLSFWNLIKSVLEMILWTIDSVCRGSLKDFSDQMDRPVTKGIHISFSLLNHQIIQISRLLLFSTIRSNIRQCGTSIPSLYNSQFLRTNQCFSQNLRATRPGLSVSYSVSVLEKLTVRNGNVISEH